MVHTSTFTAYIRFMQWFQQQHPELYRQYWQNITAPRSGGDVNIDAGGLEPREFFQLMQVQFDYYYPRQ